MLIPSFKMNLFGTYTGGNMVDKKKKKEPEHTELCRAMYCKGECKNGKGPRGMARVRGNEQYQPYAP